MLAADEAAERVDRSVAEVLADPRVVEEHVRTEHAVGDCYRCGTPMSRVTNRRARLWGLWRPLVSYLACVACQTFERVR